MSKLGKLKFQMYYDGVNIRKYINEVDGVTTNTSYIAGAKITDYNKFIEKSMKAAKGKPISFQVTDRSLEGIEKQARFICNLGDNVYVKIPVVLPDGTSTIELIKKLSKDGLNINVTCIHTCEQIKEAVYTLNPSSKSIISVFAGGISDSGNYPEEEIGYAVDLTSDYDNMEVLWAGCQHVLHVFEAKDAGCDIITIPDAIMNKLIRTKYSKHETSVRKSESFYSDGDKLVLNI
tara:strand:+ start:2004 stop:2705 length:702 start_codon:yes stop_codon:yes gene_type:complete